jgi:hypothetical protein
MYSLMLIFNNGTVKFIKDVRSIAFDEVSLEVLYHEGGGGVVLRFPDPEAFPLGAPGPQVVKMEAF